MSMLYNHANRHERLEQGRNPILLVRQSAKRQRIPDWLEPEELGALLSQIDWCFRVGLSGRRHWAEAQRTPYAEVGRYGVRQPPNHDGMDAPLT